MKKRYFLAASLLTAVTLIMGMWISAAKFASPPPKDARPSLMVLVELLQRKNVIDANDVQSILHPETTPSKNQMQDSLTLRLDPETTPTEASTEETRITSVVVEPIEAERTPKESLHVNKRAQAKSSAVERTPDAIMIDTEAISRGVAADPAFCNAISMAAREGITGLSTVQVIIGNVGVRLLILNLLCSMRRIGTT